MADNTETVSAYARIRTPNNEKSTPDIEVIAGAPERVRAGHAETPDKKIEFTLDHNFEGDATQADVYEQVGKPLVARVLDGFNATVMAYGQTGSGKTFTMLGPEEVKTDLESNKEMIGIVPRACEQLFAGLPGGCTVTLSYLEVYNNAVYDLLDSSASKGDYLKLRESVPGHVEPEGLTKVPVSSTKAVLDEIVKGDQKRVIAPMAMNPRSSRGHGLMTLQITNDDGSGGRLMLVDLAGMESSKKSAPEGASNLEKRKQEAKAINVSLLALRNVLGQLASKSPRVGWRESKLTRLLQSSLGANCKAAILVTVRSEKKNIEETIGTLKFAQNSKNVEATVVKVEAPKAGGEASAKLQAELEAALDELRRRAKETNGLKEYKAEAMMQIMSLQHDIKRLQKEAEDRNKVAVEAKKELPPETARYVASLERKVHDLEEENRVLRERDIKYRMMGLDTSGGPAKKGSLKRLPSYSMPQTIAFETTTGFNIKKDKSLAMATEIDAGKSAPVEKDDGMESPQKRAFKYQHKRGARFSAVRAAMRFIGLKTRSNRIAPEVEAYVTKTYGDVSKAVIAATRIQKHGRGYLVRRLNEDDDFYDMMYAEYDYDDDYY